MGVFMCNKVQLQQLKLKCNETLEKALSTEKECEIGFYSGWLSAMCLVYIKHDKMFFTSLQEKITKLLKERSLL